ncbi:MAG: DUF5106 domain-containing protein [Bacteroidales bacterium]|nr:DUF5106 domain-containing protein [Bacteroidales bacterium]
MRKLVESKVILFASAILLLGGSAMYGQARADAYVRNCWDGFDYSLFTGLDKNLSDQSDTLSEAYRLERKLAGYFWVLRMASDSGAQVSVRNLLDSVAVYCGSGEYPTGYDKLLEAAELYFYTPGSEYFSEKVFLMFLEHKIGRIDIAEVEKSREKYLAALIKRNMVGSMAENLALKGGRKSSLYDVLGALTERQSLMLVFFSAECGTCIDGITRLKYSPVLKKQIQEGEMAVLAVCVEGKLSHVKSVLPGDWMVASDGGAVYQDQTYSIRNTPSVYVLERSGVVLLKDADVSSAIDFLLE